MREEDGRRVGGRREEAALLRAPASLALLELPAAAAERDVYRGMKN